MTDSLGKSKERIFTIGHSNHAVETFLKLLTGSAIEVVVDVRSYPYSRYVSQFNEPALSKQISKAGIKYLYLGKELGGRPESHEFYDKDGRVLYSLLSGSPLFLQGIQRLLSGLRKFRIAIMCDEEDPKGCHRRLLIGRVLSNHGIAIYHIRGDGRVQTEEQLVQEESGGQIEGLQLTLLESPEEANWRSAKPIRSASQRDGRGTSLVP